LIAHPIDRLANNDHSQIPRNDDVVTLLAEVVRIVISLITSVLGLLDTGARRILPTAELLVDSAVWQQLFRRLLAIFTFGAGAGEHLRRNMSMC
jgi:hypothetical protein